MSPSAALVTAGLDAPAAVAGRINGFARGLDARGWATSTIDVSAARAIGDRPVLGCLPSTTRRAALRAGWEGDVRPLLGWRAQRLLGRIASDVAIVSVPPFSLLPAAACALPAAVTLVVDYRDPWSARQRPTALARITRPAERRALRRAGAITYAGGTELGRLLSTCLGVGPTRVVQVQNGFDVPDTAGLPAHRPRVERNGQPLDLVFGGYWYGRNGPGILLDALAAVGSAVAVLTVTGGLSPEIVAAFVRQMGRAPLQRRPTERRELYIRLASADAVVIPLDHASPVESRIPAKTYDCLAVGVPVIAICPVRAALLQVCGAERFHHVRNDDAQALIALLRRAQHDRSILRSGPPATGPTRAQAADALHELLCALARE